jgi:hypothetical protein
MSVPDTLKNFILMVYQFRISLSMVQMIHGFSLILLSVLLATEVAPGFLVGAEPDVHQFVSRFVQWGDQMEVNSKRYCFNSETRPGMHGQVRS